MRSGKSLLPMALITLVLGAFIFFYEKDLPSTDERREQAKKVLNLEADEVTGLEITWDGRRAVLAKESAEAPENGDAPATTWRLVEPMEARADGFQVNGLLNSLLDLEHRRELDTVDAAESGLDEPEVRVRLTTEDGDSAEFLLGAELPASQDRFAAVEGREGAYVVSATTVLPQLRIEPGEWRDKKLFTAPRTTITRLTLEDARGRRVLARRGDEFWLEEPMEDLADEDQVNALLGDLTGLTATRFVDDLLIDPASYGLDPALSVVTVEIEGEETPYRLELGTPIPLANLEDALSADPASTEDTVYAYAEGQLVELQTQLHQSTARPAQAWRSRAWTPLQVFQIEGATFLYSTGETEIRREGPDWLRNEERIDYSAASDLLYAVAEIRGETVIEASQAVAEGNDLKNPDLTLTLASEDGEQVLYLYNTELGALATREGRDAVLVLDQESAERLWDQLGAVRSAEVLPEEDGEVDGAS